MGIAVDVDARRGTMVYYVLRRHSTDDAPEVDGVEPLGFWPASVFSGSCFPTTFPEVIVTLSSLKHLENVWWAGSWLLMSELFLTHLRSLGETHLEEWPVTLRTSSGKTDRDSHRLVNLLDNVSCFNRKASKFELNEDRNVRRITKLEIHEDKIPTNRHLFRMAEASNVVLASGTLKQVWESAGIRGARFQAIDEYYL